MPEWRPIDAVFNIEEPDEYPRDHDETLPQQAGAGKRKSTRPRKYFFVTLGIAGLLILGVSALFLRGGSPSSTQLETMDMADIVKLAEKGNAEGQFNLSYNYATGERVPQNHKESFKWMKKAAEQGHTKAQFMLGVNYQEGVGVPVNIEEAVKWYKSAAEKGYVEAQAKLGIIYLKAEDLTEGFKWITKAAEQGNFRAQCSLSLSYFEGIAHTKDITKAYAWAIVAKVSDEEEVRPVIGHYEKRMTRGQIADGQKLASEIYKRIEANRKD